MKKKTKECTYPLCSDCACTFEIPACILDDAGIETDKGIIIDADDGIVTIRQDDEAYTYTSELDKDVIKLIEKYTKIKEVTEYE